MVGFRIKRKIIDISLDFILSNKYEYGPDFEDKDKEYTGSHKYARIIFQEFIFRSKIKGFATSGERYVEIDSENNILE